MINIAGQLHAATAEGILVSSAEVMDETQNKSQAQINAEVQSQLSQIPQQESYKVADLSINTDNFRIGYMVDSVGVTHFIFAIQTNTNFKQEAESIISLLANYITEIFFDPTAITPIPYINKSIRDAMEEFKMDIENLWSNIWIFNAITALINNRLNVVQSIYENVLSDETKRNVSYQEYIEELDTIIRNSDNDFMRFIQTSYTIYFCDKTRTGTFFLSDVTPDYPSIIQGGTEVWLEHKQTPLIIDGQLVINHETDKPAFTASEHIIFPIAHIENVSIDTNQPYIAVFNGNETMPAYKMTGYNHDYFICFMTMQNHIYFLNRNAVSDGSNDISVNNNTELYNKHGHPNDGNTEIVAAGKGITFSPQGIPNVITFTVVYMNGQYSREDIIGTYTETAIEGMTYAQFVDSKFNPHESERDYKHCSVGERSNIMSACNFIFTKNDQTDEDNYVGDLRWDMTEQEAQELDNLALVNGYTYYYIEQPTCLLGDTLITMADGTLKPISQIQVGDKVLSLDLLTGEQVSRAVIYSDANENKKTTKWDEWEFEDGTIIKTAHRHEFYNIEKGRFEYLDKWQKGHHTYKHDGTTPALIKHSTHEETVNHYKINLEGSTNFFANGLLNGDRYCNLNKITLK